MTDKTTSLYFNIWIPWIIKKYLKIHKINEPDNNMNINSLWYFFLKTLGGHVYCRLDHLIHYIMIDYTSGPIY